MEEDIINMRYVELRKKCKSLGLPCTGKKEQLIEVLSEHLKKNKKNDVVSEVVSEKVDLVENDEEIEEIIVKKNKTKKVATKGKTKKIIASESDEKEEEEEEKKEVVVKAVKRVQSQSPVRRETKIQKTPEKIIQEEKQISVVPVIQTKEKNRGRKGKKKSINKTPSPIKITQPEPICTSTQIENKIIEQTFIKMKEDEEEAKEDLKTTKKIESSLLTNDESSKTLNVTNDNSETPERRQSLRNKRTSSLPNKSSDNLDKTYEKIDVDIKPATKTIDDVTINNNNNKRAGGARIVKPIVNGVQISETIAGPRIVKPPNAVEEKPKTKAPDFKTLHKKLEDKMESIDVYAKRMRDRHETLKITTSTAANDGRIIKAIPIINESPIVINKKKEDLTTKPKIIRRSPSASTASSIPKITKANKVIQQQQQVPSTPKTPTSVIKSTKKTPPTSALRKIYNQTRITEQQQTTQHISRQLASITNNLNTSSVQSSAFSRRKSFDINASLAKPLAYQPHTGKLKPIDPTKTKLQQQQMRRQSIINNKSCKGDMLHDHLRLHSGQQDDKAKANQLKLRHEKRIAKQMQRRAIENNNEDSDE